MVPPSARAAVAPITSIKIAASGPNAFMDSS
jgi:hypothetical protein